MTNTNKDKIEAKISKLDALIASTTNKGEKASALLARERLLKNLRKHVKHEKSRKTKTTTENKSEQSKDTKKKKTKRKGIDEFFYKEENCLRTSDDTTNASFHQKRFIVGLVKNSSLACPRSVLDKFINQIGSKQATRIIDNLIEIIGDPRERPATDRQVAFLKRNLSFDLSEEMIGILKIYQASKIIEAIKLVNQLKKTLTDPDIECLKKALA